MSRILPLINRYILFECFRDFKLGLFVWIFILFLLPIGGIDASSNINFMREIVALSRSNRFMRPISIVTKKGRRAKWRERKELFDIDKYVVPSCTFSLSSLPLSKIVTFASLASIALKAFVLYLRAA